VLTGYWAPVWSQGRPWRRAPPRQDDDGGDPAAFAQLSYTGIIRIRFQGSLSAPGCAPGHPQQDSLGKTI